MKTKLISMQWRGSASVDPRFSAAMLPWTIADICNREQYTNVSKSDGKFTQINNAHIHLCVELEHFQHIIYLNYVPSIIIFGLLMIFFRGI